MSTGKYVSRFRFDAHGFGVTSGPASYQSAERGIHLTLEADGDACNVVISVDGRDQQAAAAEAERIIAALYERTLIEFARRVERSSPPRLESSQFAPAAGQPAPGSPGTHQMAVGETLELNEKLKRHLEVSPTAIVPILERVVVGIEAGQPPFAAALYAARNMYRVASEAGDEVVSYLILYSALGLASLFKFGPVKGSGQKALDDWILSEDPAIPLFTVTRGYGNRTWPQTETLYTHVRNNFIHSEERGADPVHAMNELRGKLGAFRSLVAGMLGKL